MTNDTEANYEYETVEDPILKYQNAEEVETILANKQK